MLLAQSRYLERKGERRVHNQRENLVIMKEKDDFLTVNPKIPSLALQKRKLIKESRGTIRGRMIERFFVIDNQLIIFFENEGDQDFQKNNRLEGAYVFVESRSQYAYDREM